MGSHHPGPNGHGATRIRIHGESVAQSLRAVEAVGWGQGPADAAPLPCRIDGDVLDMQMIAARIEDDITRGARPAIGDEQFSAREVAFDIGGHRGRFPADPGDIDRIGGLRTGPDAG